MRGLAHRKRGLGARRRLRALPEDDGKIPVLMTQQTGIGTRRFFELIDPERMHQHCVVQMENHDGRSDEERWGGNQWGEEWVVVRETRPLFLARMPLLLTDLTLPAWRALLKELRA